MSSKAKVIYICQQCGTPHPKWGGQCADCGSWNSLIEEPIVAKESGRYTGYAGKATGVIPLSEVTTDHTLRLPVGIAELDRVLGGGLVAGSTVLIGGDPGIGKSTLLLQALGNLGHQQAVLYVTGEESLQQVALRAHRLGISHQQLLLLAETQVEKVIASAQKVQPKIIAIDSIQTMYTEVLASAPGGAGQIRESTVQLMHYAKHTNTSLLIVGHVTKEGAIAGPKVLEHMVDCVLYFEGESDSRYRVVRATKNRYGAVNELGLFAMTDRGLKEVTNPSAIFLANHATEIAGSSIVVTREGSRPLLVEVQALVDESHAAVPRRVAVGFDHNRLSLLLAVLHRHGGLATYNQDIFVNIVGGLKVTETALDLALISAIVSSMRNRPLARDLVIFGELGLAGEIRPVQNGQERLKAAVKHGFKRAILPKANLPKIPIAAMELLPVEHLTEVLRILK